MASRTLGKGSFGGLSYSAASATGSPSRFGRSGAKARTLVPWGNNYPASQGRGANSIGATPFKTKLRPSGAVSRPKAAPQLWGMAYKVNDPLAWPVIPNSATGERGGGHSGMTQAKADFWNTVVNNSYVRGGYAG